MPLPMEIPSMIVLRGSEADSIDLEDMANFLRDLVFIHDRIWLAESEANREYDLNASFFYTRTGRPVPEADRLKLSNIRMASPWEMAVVISSALTGAMATAWLFFQIARGVLLLPGERQLQQLNIAKLERDLEAGSPQPRVRRPAGDLADGSPQFPTPVNEMRSVSQAIAESVEHHLILPERAEALAPMVQKDVRRILKSRMRIEQVEPRNLVHARWE